MTSFLLALQFLTVLPLKVKQFSGKKMAWALIYFPVVGLLLGGILVCLNISLSALGVFSITTNIILVVGLIILSGGMHLDGLADTTDAFLSGKEKKEMLEIMRDSHIGVMGVLSLLSIILLKIGLLSSFVTAVKPAVLILICILSRWSAVLGMYLFPYARQEGKAKPFIAGMSLRIFLTSTLITFIFAFVVMGIEGLIALLAASIFTYLFGRFAGKKINGITGDTLGAAMELTEVVVLLTLSITQGVIYG
jgi:adenosylcobinamide-GDP ribazoletransferase